MNGPNEGDWFHNHLMETEVEDCVCWHDVLKLVKQTLCYKWVQKGLMVTKLKQVNYQPIEHHL